MKKVTALRRSGIVIAIFAVAMFFGFAADAVPSYADGNLDCEYLSGSNVNGNNYTNANRNVKPVESYLTVADGGYMRVQGNVSGQGIVVAYYDADFKLTSRRTIASELPIFGAFYETANNYYIVSGQTNSEESNTKEVFRITKYSKSWTRLGSCSLKGANTETPFRAGSCRIDSTGKYLLIRTSHRMFKDDEGVNHQANVTIQVDTDSMTVTDSHTGVAGNYAGYVSHSFNQFIKLENNKIVAVDHGDAYPRSICLMKYPTNVTGGTFNSNNVETVDVLSLPGTTGNNDTGATVGGLEISSSLYLIAGSATSQGCTDLRNGTRNAFIATVNKSTNGVQVRWLTNYAEGETGVGNPFLIKTASDSYMALWSRGSTVFYTKINGSGQQVGQIYSLEGSLSDCVPLVYNNELTWYTWNDSKEVFYQIPLNDLSNPTKSETVYDHDYEHTKTENGLATLRCKKCGTETVGKVPTAFGVYWNKTGAGNYYSVIPECDIEETAYYSLGGISYSADADITLGEFIFNAEDPTNCIVDMSGEKVTFCDAGNFKITVYPKYNPTLTKTYTIKVTKPLESVSLSADLQSPQKYGKALKFTATPNGGKGTLTYNYTVTDSSGTVVKTQSNTNKDLNWTLASVGTYQIKVRVVDSYDGKEAEDSTSFVINKDDLKIKGSKTITASDITYGDKVSQITLNNASFVGDIAGTDVQGSIVFDQPNQVLNAGMHTVTWRFVPNSGNYNEFTGSTQVTVQKKTPIINSDPSAGSKVYHPSLTLTGVDISNGTAEVAGNWAWANNDQKLTVPGGSYPCRFTPNDTANYNTVNLNVNVTVTKATPYLANLSAEAITYGQTLSDSVIAFTAQYSNTDSTSVGGTAVWVAGNTKPDVNDSNVTEYDVVFTPSDTVNYKVVTASTTLVVNKADTPSVVPEDRYEVPYSTETLTNDILAGVSGWVFKGSDIDTPLSVGEQGFVARYIADDVFNFNNTEKEVVVERKACQHDGETKLRNEEVATCVHGGYSGDEYCLICNEEIEHGNNTEIDSDNHEHTTTIPGVAATYESAGLTEGLVCNDCGKNVIEQREIPKLDPTAGLNATDKANVNDISKKLGVTAVQAVEINDFASKNGISKDTLLITDESITKGNTDADMKGSTFGQLQAYAKKNTKNAVTLKWKKVPKANGYIIYSNKCGKNNKMKKLQTFTSNGKLTFTQKKLKKGTYYKYIVVAYRNIGGKKVTIYASPTIHSITKGGKNGVAKAVKVTKVGKKKGVKATIKKGKTAKITAKEIKENKPIKTHRKLAYESSNTKIATVSKKGVVKGVGKGSCKIYVYAQNGKVKVVNIKVK